VRVEKEEIESWMRHPVTQWLAETLQARFPCTQQDFINAASWEQTLRLKGSAQVLQYLYNPVELWRVDNE